MLIYKYQIPDPLKPRELGPSCKLMNFKPEPVAPAAVIGRIVDRISDHLGTYGMGGPGFFGLRFGTEWLVIAIWGAAEWMVAQGRCVGDTFYEKYGRQRPWLHNLSMDSYDELSAHIVGQPAKSIDVQEHSLKILFENGFDLTIEESPDNRPLFEGTKKPRIFQKSDDLRRAVFLSPTDEIWV